MSMSPSESRLLLAIARLCQCGPDLRHMTELNQALEAVERKNAKENGGAPPCETGAGGGDPLPHTDAEYWTGSMVRCWQDSLNENDRLKAELARLKAEAARLVQEWRTWAGKRQKQAMDYADPQCAQMLHEASLHVIRADELEKALALAASTTETPP